MRRRSQVRRPNGYCRGQGEGADSIGGRPAYASFGTSVATSTEAPSARSALLGIGVHVLWPGETPGKYHAESNQEGFLVLSGECIAIVEG